MLRLLRSHENEELALIVCESRAISKYFYQGYSYCAFEGKGVRSL